MRKMVLGLALGVVMVASVVVPMTSASAAGVVTCRVTTPAVPVATRMNTPVGGNVTCTHSGGLKVSYSLAPYRLDVNGPFNGKLAFDKSNGNFLYTPGFYPPDPKTGKQDVLPEFTGPDSFSVVGTASDGSRGAIAVPIEVLGGARSCDPKFVPTTVALFNNPAGSEAEQYAMLRYLIKMIDCTPAKNPDGSIASIRTSFYSLTYAPMQAALKAAAQRGVAVQVLTNSHADKYGAWRELAKTLGGNTFATNFATTCWQGCLTPRTPPVPGGPTAWYDAEATTLTSNTVVFVNRAIQGAAPIVKWRWNFGDGSKAEGPGPFRHTYKKAGTYRTSLTVTDSVGRTHTMVGEKTLPDNMEPEYPSLHSKVYLFSTVGAGKNLRQWVSAYSSGNPTYQQSRKGFNNLNVAVGDAKLYQVFTNYFIDLVRASRGQVLTRNYFRSASTPGNPATGSPAMTVHFGPQTVGDVNRDILNSIQCRYKVNGKWKRTDVKVSVFVLTRKGVASDLWTLAMQKGCNVEVVYTQMSQRVKGANGRWLTNGDGEPVGWGAADCLSTPATKTVVTKAKAGKPAKRKRVVNSLNGCSKGSLKGKVPVTSTGQWLNRKSPISGGRLKVQMSCPVAPKYNSVTKNWAVLCIRNDIFTHHKTLLVNGAIWGTVQKYVMSGSANWSSPGLRASDEVITEISQAGRLYDQYLSNYEYLKKVVAKNSKKKKKKSKSAAVFALDINGGRPLDVRGMTDEQLAGQAG